MKGHRFRHLFLGVLSALIVDSATQAHAFFYIKPADSAWSNILALRSELAFNEYTSYQNPIGDESLDEMRGGFVTSNGMIIDFTFTANTLVDGKLLNQIILDTAGLAASAGSLRNVLQIGEGNTAFNGAIDMNKLPNVLTVVQNNMDNLTLQQLNVLDLTVQNMNNFIRQSVTSEMDFQNSLGLTP